MGFNTSYSAGTGAFLEEQATRLNIPLKKISSMTKKAQNIQNIAGSCSVFSKTDMIHHQQEGIKTEDILMGALLCYGWKLSYK